MLDVVALTVEIPDHGLLAGHVGTVVECYDQQVAEVDFSDDKGQTYALLAVPVAHLMVLHHRPVRAM